MFRSSYYFNIFLTNQSLCKCAMLSLFSFPIIDIQTLRHGWLILFLDKNHLLALTQQYAKIQSNLLLLDLLWLQDLILLFWIGTSITTLRSVPLSPVSASILMGLFSWKMCSPHITYFWKILANLSAWVSWWLVKKWSNCYFYRGYLQLDIWVLLVLNIILWTNIEIKDLYKWVIILLLLEFHWKIYLQKEVLQRF